MCEPNTVTLIADVAATLLMIKLLGPGASIVTDAVSEFTCQPVVITTRRSVQMPVVVRVHTELSDTHVVAPHPLPPTRETPLKSTNPSPRPTTVTLIDPLLPTLAETTSSTVAAS